MRKIGLLGAVALLAGCSSAAKPPVYVPSLRYSESGSDIHRGFDRETGEREAVLNSEQSAGRPSLKMADADFSLQGAPGGRRRPRMLPGFDDSGHEAAGASAGLDDVNVYRSHEQVKARYQGPLSVGDPGVSASLWRESRGSYDIYRDDRAWRPMDILTIIVAERSSGSSDADTEIKSQSTVEAAINFLLGLETKAGKQSPPLTPESLVSASTQNNFKGEGATARQGNLTARIAGVVAEVLPGGLLRVEGEKIISVNNEEQVMILSGIVRPRDITTANEISSSQIAQLRIDYYGKGEIGSAQTSGWFSRIMRWVWPF
jgi:flagellar L-ring protein FlgH